MRLRHQQADVAAGAGVVSAVKDDAVVVAIVSLGVAGVASTPQAQIRRYPGLGARSQREMHAATHVGEHSPGVHEPLSPRKYSHVPLVRTKGVYET